VCRHSHSMPEGQGVASSQAGTQTRPECLVRHRPEGQSADVRQVPASAALQAATPVRLPEDALREAAPSAVSGPVFPQHPLSRQSNNSIKEGPRLAIIFNRRPSSVQCIGYPLREFGLTAPLFLWVSGGVDGHQQDPYLGPADAAGLSGNPPQLL
jgi:hypothetical protein